MDPTQTFHKDVSKKGLRVGLRLERLNNLPTKRTSSGICN